MDDFGIKQISRTNTPSVKNVITVVFIVQSSNLTQYPTSSPKMVPISFATLLAKDCAKIRLGCVHIMLFLFIVPSLSII